MSKLAQLHPRRLFGTLDEVGHLQSRVDQLQTRVHQLVAAHETTEKTAARVRGALAAFAPERIVSHVTTAVSTAPLLEDPFPHVVIDELLPADAYNQLFKAIPPRLFFEHLERNHQEVTVPSDLAPLFCREVWAAFYGRAVTQALAPGLLDKFQGPLDQLVRRYWPTQTSLADADIRLDLLMSRILLRRPGYVIKPHRDPRWAFLTCLVYRPAPKTQQLFGTELCRVREDRDPPSHSAF